MDLPIIPSRPRGCLFQLILRIGRSAPGIRLNVTSLVIAVSHHEQRWVLALGRVA